MRRGVRRAGAAALAAAALCAVAADACPIEPLRAGDAAWSQRAVGANDDGRAADAHVLRAVDAYERAVAEAPECLEAHGKLLHAWYFAADHAARDDEQRRARLDAGVRASERALAAIAARLDGAQPAAVYDPRRLRRVLPPHDQVAAARAHFWSAVVVASWARAHGVLDAVRTGAATRVRDSATVTAALEPGFEAGGAHRLLAALHGELPRIPLLTPWVDGKRALEEAERAYEIAPEHPSNQLCLSLVLLDDVSERRGEALALLRRVASLEPAERRVVEDRALRRMARERLAREEAATAPPPTQR
ncbi:MAG: hypothetical protein DCC71_11535 [Proteobacteria bacterium]|nr:MAG: hypothetical protein DCC71_11535 [Pseudomonadota bacterium]